MRENRKVEEKWDPSLPSFFFLFTSGKKEDQRRRENVFCATGEWDGEEIGGQTGGGGCLECDHSVCGE